MRWPLNPGSIVSVLGEQDECDVGSCDAKRDGPLDGGHSRACIVDQRGLPIGILLSPPVEEPGLKGAVGGEQGRRDRAFARQSRIPEMVVE